MMSLAPVSHHAVVLRSNTPMHAASGTAVRKSGQKLPKFGHIFTQAWTEQVGHFLRARYPVKTADSVAADLDVSASTVRKWLDGTSAPSVRHFRLMIYAYQADFLAAVVPGLAFVEETVALGRRDEAERQFSEAQAQLDEFYGGRRP